MNLKCWQPSFVLVLMAELRLLAASWTAGTMQETDTAAAGEVQGPCWWRVAGAKWATCAAATLAKSAD